jgi:hypothetical protein
MTHVLSSSDIGDVIHIIINIGTTAKAQERVLLRLSN